nr:DUF1214 domain-containing protein [Bradyrhizobium tropiciagri]
MVFRPVIVGSGTMEGAVALARQTHTYPLAAAANPPATRVIDGWDKAWRSLPVYDHTWFEKLAAFVTDEPVRPRDKVMVGMLGSLGIANGKPFAPDARMVAALDDAARDAYNIMQYGFATPGEALAAWWPDSQWMNFNPALEPLMGDAWSFETTDAVWTWQRAIAPFFWANYLPAKLSGEQIYLVGLRDSGGKLLSGKGRYRLRVPADVPVNKFWSVIAYSQKTRSFVPNSLDRGGLDSYAGSDLKANKDGSIDIFLGAAQPGREATGCLRPARISS